MSFGNSKHQYVKNKNNKNITYDKIEKVFPEHVLNPIDTFKLKGKSKCQYKNFEQQIAHVYEKYPVPSRVRYCWYEVLLAFIPRHRYPIIDQDIIKFYTTSIDQGFSYSVNNVKTSNVSVLGVKLIDIYINLATGKSIYKELFKNILTKKEIHVALYNKFDYDIYQSIVYAISKGMGATESQSMIIANSQMSNIVRDHTDIDFVRNTLMVIARFNFNSEQLSDVYDYVKWNYQNDKSFRVPLKGLTYKSLLKRVRDWEYQMSRIERYGTESWTGLSMPDWEYTDVYSVDWVITELRTAKDLALEGTSQRHCVFSYVGTCNNGHSSIFSLRRVNGNKQKTAVTIEVSMRNGKIVQMRGKANSEPDRNHYHIIKKWVSVYSSILTM